MWQKVKGFFSDVEVMEIVSWALIILLLCMAVGECGTNCALRIEVKSINPTPVPIQTL